MCNELQVAAFQISRAETDLTPGPLLPLLEHSSDYDTENNNEEKAQRPHFVDGDEPNVPGQQTPKHLLWNNC